MREGQILTILKENDYLKINHLAKKIGVSSRTIRNDLQGLSELQQGFKIERSAKLGCRLVILDEEKFSSYLAGFTESTIEMQKDRLDSLLSLLLIDENYQTVKQLSDELLVSSSQIKKDLSKLERYLKDSPLILERKAHYGIRLICELKNRLLLLQDYYQKGNVKLLEKLETTFTVEKQKKLKDNLYHLIDKNKWNIDYIEFRRLEEELFLLLLTQKKEKQSDTDKSNSLLTEILHGTGLSVPNQREAHDYFEASLLAKTKKLEILSNKQVLKEEITNFFQQMDQQQKTHFSTDQEFIDLVYLHVAALIERSRKEVKFSNPYLEDISKDYPVIFNFAVMFSKWLEEKFKLRIASDEIGYLATHMTVPYHKWQQKLIENIYRIAVVCSSGGGMAYLVEMKLKRIFPRAKIQTFSMFEIEQIKDYYPDLIFSIIELTIEIDCPVILMSEIQSELDYLEVSENLSLLRSDESFSIERSFFELFSESLFRIERGQSYSDILMDLAVQVEETIGFKGYKDSLLERENYLSTIYQNGVAIPHPLLMSGKENRVAVCLLPEGASSAGRTAKIIFMVSLKAEQLDIHQIISKELSKLMNHPAAINMLAESKNYHEFYYTLKRVLGRRN
ncbi:BglG family transcription antiterminator [Enterococcus raffinosus]|uniref:PRD domain-containing protein n=1 Tax=Enterococcus raffinosus TaxID=71452 RepID=A0AAW8TDG3_9ENTE|nr:PRD domain-containing protein [Enterococcus raffinosus]MDT2524795.1 PRD domain-containing protein [Enterococcus raffinosus]MDT2530805.1 PRD domain-containing protein [Enterococcus raffinosus]MDT2535538.1 PRD domain-containing protein [Enterococcus raffinosus]MDT2545834.1 PRD domain-containing protein [Enterococcus raffinosus]MDT2556467.1 PRD domain-containing protein [Enterococcus raffinosus]